VLFIRSTFQFGGDMDHALQHRRSRAALLGLALDRTAAESLQRQLYGQVREAVLAGRLAPGTRLPSTRALASELACSRNTVLGAFDQLIAEGYLECRAGSGSYVSHVLPETLLTRPAGRQEPDNGERRIGGATEVDAASYAEQPPFGIGAGGRRPFAPGVPDLSLFPFDIWGRLLGRIWRRPAPELLLAGPPAGYLPLRAAIAAYLRGLRSVACSPEQLFITAGAQPALDLVARVLLKPGDRVWIEEPGYPGLRGPLAAAGARLVPVPLDEEGVSVDTGRALADAAALAVVAPSHQYPLGTTMSLARRLELLDWARDRGAWLVEDDYDSEYRYAGRPLAALQGLDAGGAADEERGRVFYIGTFSKVLFPAIRLGYLVVPKALVDEFARARAAIDAYPSAIVQPVLAAFMAEGHFAAHVRRMRTVYARRREALLTAGGRHLEGLLELAPGEGGLHLVGRLSAALARRLSDREAEARAAAVGLAPRALSRFYLAPPEASYRDTPPRGLLLGFAALADEEIEPAVQRLANVLGRAPG
jgi:GntR family transcriptional regulator / MocR family aminotransferase